MSHSILATVLASAGAVAGNLMQIQERAEARRAIAIDPRDLPEHLQRDIGLADGHSFGEEAPNAHLAGRAATHWADHIQTPHAA